MREERAILGSTEPWLRGIALVIWAFIGVSRLDGQPRWWLVPWLLWGVGVLIGAARSRLPDAVNVANLAMQSVSVLLLPHTGLVGFEGMLLSFVVVQAPTVVSMRTSVAWAIVQLPVVLAVTSPFNNVRQLMELSGAYSGFSAFALLVHHVRMQERKARLELARSNASLLGTRALLVEGSRQAERLRISRELHDSLGHHLTALRLQLELAQRQTTGKGVDALGRARDIAQAALAEVRKVVSQMQADQGIELVPALKALAAGLPSPHIEIRAPEGVDLEDGEASHALFRCVQEAITNSIKHASARHIWVDIARGPRGLDITVRDDGAGAANLQPGNGLTGMNARLTALGGGARFESPPSGGFAVHLNLPVQGA